MAAVGSRHRLFTMDEYHKLGESGVLDEDDRVELVEGELIHMPPIGSPHAGCFHRDGRPVVVTSQC
jgi:Uma2 family endonuclease